MKIKEIAKQLANKINQEHYVMHYLEKIQKSAYKKGYEDAKAEQLPIHNVGSMLDLDKLQKKFDEILDNITEEDLQEWMDKKG